MLVRLASPARDGTSAEPPADRASTCSADQLTKVHFWIVPDRGLGALLSPLHLAGVVPRRVCRSPSNGRRSLQQRDSKESDSATAHIGACRAARQLGPARFPGPDGPP